jgi:hypothetical protein
LETIQIAAGIPRPKIKDSNQHPSRPDETPAVGTLATGVSMLIGLRRSRIWTKANPASSKVRGFQGKSSAFESLAQRPPGTPGLDFETRGSANPNSVVRESKS